MSTITMKNLSILKEEAEEDLILNYGIIGVFISFAIVLGFGLIKF
jgi:hypothetical protein